MSNWVILDEIHRFYSEEQKAALRRGDLIKQYQANWTNEEWEEMSNRKKLKGTLIDHSERRTSRIERIQDTFVGRYNGYICAKCGLGYLTLDVDPGTTPMFGPCFATPGCKGQAHSMGYPESEPPLSLGDPIIYWVKPDEETFAKLPSELKIHVMQGGLIRKATESAPEWVRELL